MGKAWSALKEQTAGSARQGFKCGIIGDIQYCDCEDATDFSGVQTRYFRNSLRILEEVAQTWRSSGVDFIVNIGDAVDGRCGPAGAAALQRVLGAFQAGIPDGGRRYDILGNHELYVLSRPELGRFLNFPSGVCYQAWRPCPGWRCVILDGYDVAVIGRDGSREHADAEQVLRDNNPRALEGHGVDWFAGLEEAKHRYVPFNGALGATQLSWLRRVLQEAKLREERVLVFTHIPLVKEATVPKCVVWNAEEVLTLLHEHDRQVVAVIAGHDHDGGYCVDSHGVHHLTLVSPLVVPPGELCGGVLEASQDGSIAISGSLLACESGTFRKGEQYRSFEFRR